MLFDLVTRQLHAWKGRKSQNSHCNRMQPAVFCEPNFGAMQMSLFEHVFATLCLILADI